MKDSSQNDIPLAGELTVTNHEALMKLYVAKDPHSIPFREREWIQALNLIPNVFGVNEAAQQTNPTRIKVSLKLKDPEMEQPI